MSTYYYLYGITEKEVSLTNGLFSETYEDFYGIVEEVGDDFSESKIAENLQNQAWVIDKAKKHQQVVGALAQATDVIPLAFGSIFKTKEAIRTKIGADASRFKRPSGL